LPVKRSKAYIYHREWATNHAIKYITENFNQRRLARYRLHATYLQTIPHYTVYAQYRGRPPLHAPILATLHRQIADADADLRRDIDADWKACVLRYPEVLAHFYSLVRVRLPPEADPPQLKGLAGAAPDDPAGPPRPLDFGPGPRPDELPGRSAGDLSAAAGSAHRPPPPSTASKAGVARAASTTKKSAAGAAKRSAGAAARAERGKELDRDLAADLYPRGAERRRSTGGGGLAGLGVPPPPTSVGGGGERPRARRRDSGGYYVSNSGRSGVPPGAPMPPAFWPPF